MKDPTAKDSIEGKSLTPRVDTLDGKTIGLFRNIKRAAEPVSDVVAEKLSEEHPTSEFTKLTSPARSDEDLAKIAEWASGEPDVVIITIGDCGGCTRSVVRATNAIEEAGMPAVGIVAEGFELTFETNAADQGRELRYQALPIRSEMTDRDAIRECLTEDSIDGIRKQLTEPLTDVEKGMAAGGNLL